MDVRLGAAILTAIGSLLCAAIVFYTRYLERKLTDDLAQRNDELSKEMIKSQGALTKDIEKLKVDLSLAQTASSVFLQKQLHLYLEVSDIAAQIAVNQEGPDREKAISRFWNLYWGNLALVEDVEVEGAMVNFADALKISSPELKFRSLELAHACRDSLMRSWNVKLGKLQNRRS